MLTVEEARAAILKNAASLAAERIAIDKAAGRALATDITARIDQPPFRASAMDGYAVRFADAGEGALLRVIGESAAGRPFPGNVGKGEAVRIFTGAAVPPGADHIVIQEEARADGRNAIVAALQRSPSHVRAAGIDFSADAIVKRRGARLTPLDLALIAAANVAEVDVARRPTVAYFDNGDELVEPGATLKPGAIVGSIRFAMNGLIAEWGGEALYLGRAPDNPDAIRRKFHAARDADVVVAIGGASTGDYDHMRGAFAGAGGEIVFSKVSVKPGKPTWFGRLGDGRVLGLPGNPASAIVCSLLFLKPLIEALSGVKIETPFVRALSTGPIAANGGRETYHRGMLRTDASARLMVSAFDNQDSSLLSPLAAGNCLIRRAANAPALASGDLAECLITGTLTS